MSELHVVETDDELLDYILHNPDGSGWHFSGGDPEFWKYSNQLVVPGGKALDLGIGWGRSSFYLASEGMSVEGYDINVEQMNEVSTIVSELSPTLPLDITCTYRDITKGNFGHEQYDTVIAASLVHMPSKESAAAVYQKGYDALIPGGHMWIRAMGKESSAYIGLIQQSCYDRTVTVIDNDVIEHPCNCSGNEGIDPTVFFDQTELLELFSTVGANIIHSQCAPTDGQMNIMFGEDHHRGQVWVERGGMISLLVQKPQK